MRNLEIPLQEYALRRTKIFAKMEEGSIAILPSASLVHRNGDAEYPFRQNSDFYYLTGLSESDCILVLSKEMKGKMISILFCRPHDKEEERWVGPRLGLEGVQEKLKVDIAYSIYELDKKITELLSDKKTLYYTFGNENKLDNRVINWVNEIKTHVRRRIHAPDTFKDLHEMIHELRVIKSESEILLMKEAARITAFAHEAVMKATKPGIKEYELEAEFVYTCMRFDGRFMAYTPIVASGKNSLTLHYIANDAECKAGELILVDAGAEYKNYAADVTRTFPVDGKFSVEQKLIYELVLNAQMAGIEIIKPGIAWDAIQNKILDVLCRGLIDLGLLEGTVSDAIKNKSYHRFYMHSSGHWLGLDVHDAGQYGTKKESRPLEAGMVLTVEPGLYISPNELGVDNRWCGIGVRIEDDVLVTKNGYQVLTESIPKTVEDIEKIMAQNK